MITFYKLFMSFGHNYASTVVLGLPAGGNKDDSLAFVAAGYLKVQLQFRNHPSFTFVTCVKFKLCPASLSVAFQIALCYSERTWAASGSAMAHLDHAPFPG